MIGSPLRHGILGLLGTALFVTAFPAGSAAQDGTRKGVEVETSLLWTTLVGGSFPHDETGFGGSLAARYSWPSGLSLGVAGLYARPETTGDSDAPHPRLEEIGALAEVRYALPGPSVVSPHVGVRAGWLGLHDRDGPGADGTGVTYGIVAGLGVRAFERAGFHVSAAASGFTLSGWLPGSVSANSWVLETGLTVFLGDVRRDRDGDGVRDRLDDCTDTPAGLRVTAAGCPVDEDRDEVPDQLDACPGTPRGAATDELGCLQDGDGDGVHDGLDRCPETAAGAPVDSAGCARDGDGDGVHDGLDECPETPQGTEVGGTGCPRDADGDGIPDAADRCPGTASTGGLDEEGCSRVQREFETGRILVEGLPFEFDAVRVLPELRAILQELGRRLADDPDLRLQVGVHTDAVGPAAYNERMSRTMAEAVEDHLLETFPSIGDDRVEAVGYGETEPVASNETREGRARNRRIEFVVVGSEGSTR